MEPEIADEYDRLMDTLQEAAEEDPHGERANSLRRLIAAFLREHVGSVAAAGDEPELPGTRTTH